jgi:hypothetical protein
MVQFVMTSMVIYLAISSDLPPWALKLRVRLKEIVKIRSFLWRGRETNGGHCLLTWPRVSWPKELGGLGIHGLKSLGCCLRMRWLWLAKTQPNRPWAEFKIMLHPSVHAFFSRAVFTVVGDGKSTLFGLISGCMASPLSNLILTFLLWSPRVQQKDAQFLMLCCSSSRPRTYEVPSLWLLCQNILMSGILFRICSCNLT